MHNKRFLNNAIKESDREFLKDQQAKEVYGAMMAPGFAKPQKRKHRSTLEFEVDDFDESYDSMNEAIVASVVLDELSHVYDEKDEKVFSELASESEITTDFSVNPSSFDETIRSTSYDPPSYENDSLTRSSYSGGGSYDSYDSGGSSSSSDSGGSFGD